MFFTLIFAAITSSFSLDDGSQETEKWTRFLLEERREQTREALSNADPWAPLFKQIFQREGIPENLMWLALIETSFRPEAVSPSGARGMFQFKRDTALAFGLKITRENDDRDHPLLAAHAAARYLSYLREKFPSWELALAAFNLGEGDLRRTMAATGSETWQQVQPHVRAETRDYVGKVKAAALIGNRYLESRAAEPPGAYAYSVRKGDTLYAIARRFQIELERLKAINGIRGNTIHPGQTLLIPLQ